MKLTNTLRPKKETLPGGTTFKPPGREDFEPRKLNVPRFGIKLTNHRTSYLPFRMSMEVLLRIYR